MSCLKKHISPKQNRQINRRDINDKTQVASSVHFNALYFHTYSHVVIKASETSK